MATGLSPTLANSILNHFRGSTPWTQPAGLFVKLHTGDPGAAGTTAAAGNTVRTAATFGTPAGGSMTNTAAIAWTNVSTAETYSHVSVWDAATGGVFLWSGVLAVARPVTVGADFQIKIGEITATFGVAA
jgi:hypothetical protein